MLEKIDKEGGVGREDLVQHLEVACPGRVPQGLIFRKTLCFVNLGESHPFIWFLWKEVKQNAHSYGIFPRGGSQTNFEGEKKSKRKIEMQELHMQPEIQTLLQSALECIKRDVRDFDCML